MTPPPSRGVAAAAEPPPHPGTAPPCSQAAQRLGCSPRWELSPALVLLPNKGVRRGRLVEMKNKKGVFLNTQLRYEKNPNQHQTGPGEKPPPGDTALASSEELRGQAAAGETGWSCCRLKRGAGALVLSREGS